MNKKFKRFVSSTLAAVMTIGSFMVVNVNSVMAGEVVTVNFRTQTGVGGSSISTGDNASKAVYYNSTGTIVNVTNVDDAAYTGDYMVKVSNIYYKNDSYGLWDYGSKSTIELNDVQGPVKIGIAKCDYGLKYSSITATGSGTFVDTNGDTVTAVETQDDSNTGVSYFYYTGTDVTDITLATPSTKAGSNEGFLPYLTLESVTASELPATGFEYIYDWRSGVDGWTSTNTYYYDKDGNVLGSSSNAVTTVTGMTGGNAHGLHTATDSRIVVTGVKKPVKVTMGTCQFNDDKGDADKRVFTVANGAGTVLGTMDNTKTVCYGQDGGKVEGYFKTTDETISFTANGKVYLPYFKIETISEAAYLEATTTSTATITVNGLEAADLSDAVIATSNGTNVKYNTLDDNKQFTLTVKDDETYTAQRVYGGQNVYTITGSVGYGDASATFTAVKKTDVTAKDNVDNTYLLYDGSFFPQTSNTFQYICSADGLVTFSSTAQNMKYHNEHGINTKGTETISIKVAGNSTIDFYVCKYSNNQTDGKKIYFVNGDTNEVVGDLHSANDGDAVTYNYVGSAATLQFKLDGSSYLHGLKVHTNTSAEDLRNTEVKIGAGEKYTTINAALAAVAVAPTEESQRITLLLKPGTTYSEQVHLTTPYVTIKADESDVAVTEENRPVVTWYYGFGYKYDSMGSDGFYSAAAVADDESYSPNSNASSTWGATLFVDSSATDFKAEKVYFENSFNKRVVSGELDDIVGVDTAQTGKTAAQLTALWDARKTDSNGSIVKKYEHKERAAAVSVKGDRAEFTNCKISSSQDTLGYNSDLSNRSYFKNCTIEGNVDFICGAGYMYFDGCTLNFIGYSDKAANDAMVTAPKSHPYLFKNCTLGSVKTNSNAITGYFGRAWAGDAPAYFLNCNTNGLIVAAGWSDWITSDWTHYAKDANFYEYGNTTNGTTAFTSAADVNKTFMGMYNKVTAFDTAFLSGWTISGYDSAINSLSPITFKQAVVDSGSLYAIVSIDEAIASEFDKIGIAFGSSAEKAKTTTKYKTSGTTVYKGVKINDTQINAAEGEYVVGAKLNALPAKVYVAPFVISGSTTVYNPEAVEAYSAS